MLKKLDKYIIKKYLITFFYTIVLISAVAVAMDVSERIGKFISNDLSFKEVAIDYYAHFLPWLNGELWPLFAFLSVIFFTSRMAKDSEIIAMLSSGMHYNRILRPMLIGAAIVASLHWVGENYVIPHSTYHLNEFKSKYIKRSIKKVLSNDIQFFISEDQKIYCRYFNKRDSSLKHFRLEKFNIEGELESFFKAERLTYKSESGKWRAKNYEMRSFDDLKEGLLVGGKDVELDTTINIKPGDFIRHSKQMEIMSTPELHEYIAYEKVRGLDNTNQFAVESYKRTSGPFTIFILTLIGASIGTKKIRGGLGMHLALGVGIGAVYVVLSKFSETFACNLDVLPIIGVWIPNLFFLGVAIYLFNVAQK